MFFKLQELAAFPRLFYFFSKRIFMFLSFFFHFKITTSGNYSIHWNVAHNTTISLFQEISLFEVQGIIISPSIVAPGKNLSKKIMSNEGYVSRALDPYHKKSIFSGWVRMDNISFSPVKKQVMLVIKKVFHKVSYQAWFPSRQYS